VSAIDNIFRGFIRSHEQLLQADRRAAGGLDNSAADKKANHMTNNITPTSNTTQILPPDAFLDDDYGFDDGLLLFDGKIGHWTYTQDKIELPPGAKAVALVDQTLKGFTRFDGGKPTSRLLPLWPAPDLPALRQTLGDLDQSLWVGRDSKGRPKDPWQAARKLPVILLVQTLDCLVYSTSSINGVIAVSQLCRAVLRERRDPARASVLPIVSLASDSYLSANKQFGKIFKPVFDLDRWTTHDAVDELMRGGDFGKLLAEEVLLAG
jgi:hypothetical protein